MPITPRSRPQMKQEEACALFDKTCREIGVDPATLPPVRVLAIRGYYRDTMGKKGRNDRGIYDDAFIVMSPTAYVTFNGNTDPSIYRKRVAVVKAPQLLWYKPGTHWGKIPHKAFRQDAPVTVLRDGVGEDRGMFGINNHRGGLTGTSSLGCQTVYKPQWPAYRDLVNGELARYGQKRFPYVLTAVAE